MCRDQIPPNYGNPNCGFGSRIPWILEGSLPVFVITILNILEIPFRIPDSCRRRRQRRRPQEGGVLVLAGCRSAPLSRPETERGGLSISAFASSPVVYKFKMQSNKF